MPERGGYLQLQGHCRVQFIRPWRKASLLLEECCLKTILNFGSRNLTSVDNMTQQILDSIQLRKALIYRFAIAITLAAITILLSAYSVFAFLGQSKSDGYLINISGRQRMLSQRVALLLTTSPNPKFIFSRSMYRNDGNSSR